MQNSFASTAYHFVKHCGRIIGFFLADFGFKYGYQAAHLRLGQSNIEPNIKMAQ